MILGVLDFETTGDDLLQDQVWEVGQIIYSTDQRRVLESSGYFIATDRLMNEKVAKKMNLNPVVIRAMCKRFGYDDQDSLQGIVEWTRKVDAVLGQNINQFDWPLLQSWAARYNQTLPSPLIIDTMWDLPGIQGRALQHMAADDGFLNLSPHCALADCQTTLKLIENRLPILDQIVERAKSSIVVLQSLQNRDRNDLAKDRKFHWNGDFKVWWKAVKEIDVEEIAKEAPFDVTIRRDLNLRELWS